MLLDVKGGNKFGGLGFFAEIRCERGPDTGCRGVPSDWSFSLSLFAPPLLVKHCRNSAQIDLTSVERVCVCAEVGVEGRARRER